MILVDCVPEHGTRYPYMMVATDGREELAAFGRRLGLKKTWIRGEGSGARRRPTDFDIPHFRINALKRREALALGAREASMKEIVEATERAA